MERFGPSMSEGKFDKAIKQRIPLKTQKKKRTQWAISVFRSFCDARRISDSVGNLPVEKLAVTAKVTMEARQQDRTPYPPNTPVMLLRDIQRHLWEPTPQLVSQYENSFTLSGGVVLNFHFGN